MCDAVRRVTHEDIDDVVQLNREVQALHARHDPDHFKAEADPAAIAEYFAGVVDIPDNEMAIVGPRGAPRGYLWFEHQTVPESVFMHPVSRLLIHHIAVTESVRRQGVGMQLMAWAEERGRALGANTLRLAYIPANVEAHAFYQRLGFATDRMFLNKKL